MSLITTNGNTAEYLNSATSNVDLLKQSTGS